MRKGKISAHAMMALAALAGAGSVEIGTSPYGGRGRPVNHIHGRMGTGASHKQNARKARRK